MFTHTLNWQYTASGNTESQNITVTADGEDNRDITVAALATDYLVAYALDYSQCKGLFILADADMTLEINSSSAPDQTISLTANVPVAWVYGGFGSCPITAVTTSLYVTSTAGGTLKIRTLVDSTVS